MAGEGDDLNQKIIGVARSYMPPPRSSKPAANRKSPAKDLASTAADSSKRSKAASPKPSAAAEKKRSKTKGVATGSVRKSSRLLGVEAADMSVNRAEKRARDKRRL